MPFSAHQEAEAEAHTRLGQSCGPMPWISTSRRQASINRSPNLDFSSGGPTVQTDGGAAARTPALNLLRSCMNEVSEGADSVARRMTGGGGDALPSGLTEWNGSSAPSSLAGEDYSSNYPADVDADAKGGDSDMAFQKWRTQMRAKGSDDSELTKEAHQFATRPGSVAHPPTRAAAPAEERPIVHI